ncbi:MAG: hypothetical protein HKP27_01340, partial [Myxococcales bacterium]|nr:hypothetical protein [Myxococcales bacterium]
MDARSLAFSFSLMAMLSADTALALEEPSYTVERREEAFEIRRYAPYVVAEYQSEAAF